MTRVILNDRVLFKPLTGVGQYVSQLLRALQAEAGEFEVHPFLTELLPGRHQAGPGELPVASGPCAPQRPSAVSQKAKGVARRLLERPYEALFRWRSRRYDLYHEPNHIPIRCGVPTVTTIHDLSVVRHPQWHPQDRIRWYEREFERGSRQTRRFIAASEFTKREMVDLLGIAPGQIDVTLQAARPVFGPRGEASRQACRQRLGLPERFFLFAGTLEPRKNVEMLLEAHAALPDPVRRSCPLVLAGGWGWRAEGLAEALKARRGRRLGCWGMSVTRIWRICTRRAQRWSGRVCTRGSACRRWRRWRVAVR